MSSLLNEKVCWSVYSMIIARSQVKNTKIKSLSIRRPKFSKVIIIKKESVFAIIRNNESMKYKKNRLTEILLVWEGKAIVDRVENFLREILSENIWFLWFVLRSHPSQDRNAIHVHQQERTEFENKTIVLVKIQNWVFCVFFFDWTFLSITIFLAHNTSQHTHTHTITTELSNIFSFDCSWITYKMSRVWVNGSHARLESSCKKCSQCWILLEREFSFSQIAMEDLCIKSVDCLA
jgi:hypothetical protein